MELNTWFKIAVASLFFFNSSTANAQTLQYFYPYHSVETVHNGHCKDGYWLFYPKEAKDSLNLVVFMHGYGAYDPFIYGAWIEHIVKQGNVVIYPRYQTNLIHPRASRFPHFAVKGIKGGLEYLQDSLSQLEVRTQKMAYLGHSYGGVIISNILANNQRYKLPDPSVALLCTPGSGPLKGARLKKYDKIPADLKLVTISAQDDDVVGSEFSELLVETAEQINLRWWFHQKSAPFCGLTAGHNECYSLSNQLDFGLRNYTAKKALRIGRTDEVDHKLFWKIFDDLLALKDVQDVPVAYYSKKWQILNEYSQDFSSPILVSRFLPVKEN